DIRPGTSPVVEGGGPCCRDRPLALPAVWFAGQAWADRHGPGWHDHIRGLGDLPTPAFGPWVAVALAGCLRGWRGYGNERRGLSAVTLVRAVGLSAEPAETANRAGDWGTRELVHGSRGIPGRNSRLARAAGLGCAGFG